MSLVDFSKLPYYGIGTTGTPVKTATDLNPASNYGLSSGSEASWTGTVYNNDWGYFVFGQEIRFDYKNNVRHYQSKGVFNIQGTFTVNAEYSGEAMPDSEETKFNKMKEKYTSLQSIFINAAKSEPPKKETGVYDFSKFGTVNDSRCIPLPYPLVNSNMGRVYARPISLSIQETRWPELIKYTAVLEEMYSPSCKVAVDGNIIDKGVITINARKPRLKLQNYAFANGSEVYFSGWDERSYQVSGIIPSVPPSGQLSTTNIRWNINNLMDGKVNIGKIDSDGILTNMYTDLFVSGPSITITPDNDEQGTQISFSAKE